MKLIRSWSNTSQSGHLATGAVLVFAACFGMCTLRTNAASVRVSTGVKVNSVQEREAFPGFQHHVDWAKVQFRKSLLIAQNVSSDDSNITATQMYDNFESYGDTLPVTNWPTPGGYMINAWGNPNAGLFPSLSTDYQADGKYSMKLGYNIEASLGYAGTGHLLTDAPDWSPWDGVRFWLKPDGSGRTVTFQILEQIGADGVHHTWNLDYKMDGTTPVVITAPWSAFYGDSGHQMNLTGLTEQVWWVNGTPGPGTFYVDKIELIKTASPLTGIVVTPADMAVEVRRHQYRPRASVPLYINAGGSSFGGFD